MSYKTGSTSELKIAHINSVGNSPLSPLGISFVMVYAMGVEVNLFNLVMLCNLFSRSMTGILNVNHVFAVFDNDHFYKDIISKEKRRYMFFHFLAFCGCIYQCARMGLIPAYKADWIVSTYSKPHATLI